MLKQLRILVYGAGPLGSLFAARLQKAGHANAVRDEMKLLADEFSALARATTLAMPALDQLLPYLDAATPPMREGSVEIPRRWQ